MRITLKTAAGALLMGALMATPALAEQESGDHDQMAQGTEQSAGENQRLSGTEIRDQLMGNRISGAMSDGTEYSEVYRVDGTIEGEDYTGQASIEGNQMCFDYGDGESCYQVNMVGDDRIEWVQDGEVVGHGTITPVE